MRKWVSFFLQLLVLLPFTIIVIGFAVANRQSIVIVLDPLSEEASAFAVTMPLYVLVFASLFAGFLIGAFISWVKAGRHRKAARQAKRDLKKLQSAKAATIIAPVGSQKSALSPSMQKSPEIKTLQLMANNSAQHS